MLNAKDIGEFVKKELEPYFLNQGFKSKSEKEFVFSYSKEEELVSTV